VSEKTADSSELRSVALADIQVADQFNPRSEFDREQLERLRRSIEQHGVLQPLVVSPDADGGYRLIAGERRYRAAGDAGLAEVPVLVRRPEADSGDGLDLALAENLGRSDLNPLDEARAFKRLLDETGLTRKGVAERLSLPQKRVTERLAILELPAELQPKVASGEIPPGAIKALVALAKLHPQLPQVAAARVVTPPPNAWDEPVTWSQLSADPIGVVVGQYEAKSAELPADVYEAGLAYPLGRFALSDKAGDDAAKLCKLLGIEPEALSVRFDSQEVEQAEALKAAHRSREGHAVLIVGQDVADQLAGDHIARRLKEARAQQRRRREWERNRAQHANGSSDGHQVQEQGSEEELRERRRREREAEQERRRQAVGHNSELGSAVVKAFARVKLDERAVKVLATLNLGGELDQLAMRGARYGFPGWVEQTQIAGGKPKAVYIERRDDAGARAREYLSVAKTGSELAGRLLALVAMARYADEAAVAQSAQSYYHLPVPSGLPWAGEIVDLIDELAAERLPDHLTAAKRAERAKQREQDAERERLRQSIAERIANGDKLEAKQRSQLREEIARAYRPYSREAHELYRRLDEFDRETTVDDQANADSEPPAEEVSAPDRQ
jgi:ParB/RepB/Spo0J family partition protein